MAYVTYIDQTGLPEAVSYYRAAKLDRLKSGAMIEVDKVVPFSNASMFDMLTAIAKGSGDIPIIVCHATPPFDGHTGALLVNVAPSSTKPFDDVAMDGIMKPGDAKADMALAKTLDLDANVLKAMRDLRSRVLSLRLQRLVIRGCNIGQSATTMKNLRDFFGCPVCAPRVTCVFGYWVFSSMGKDKLSQFKLDNFDCTEEEGIAYVLTWRGYHVKIDAVASDEQAATKFTDRHGLRRVGQTLPFMALAPDLKHLSFSKDNDFTNYLVG